ncbi:MAG: transporter substrate-binding domain-containing protein [Desulfatibacillum sp.]|nr:transporter substrate-binding domain-containing protein [Desulfatibacillum sp.]
MKLFSNRSIRIILVAAMLTGLVLLYASDASSPIPLPEPPDTDLPPLDQEPQKTGEPQELGKPEDIDQAVLNEKILEHRKTIESKMDENAQEGDHFTLLESFQKDRFKGDLDQIRERGVLRVLISMGRTNFFFSDGKIRGFEFELMREFEKALNQDLEPGQRPVKVFFFPTPFDELVDSLDQGLGDVIAAGLTITPERNNRVRFTRPYIRNVKEVLVVNKSVKNLHSLEDLSGRQVYVQSGSSYVDSLEIINEILIAKNLSPVTIVQGDPTLTNDDILELVNAGAVKITVADSHVAQIWGKALPDIRVRENLAISKGGKIAWAVRKDNHQLRSRLNEFLQTHKKGTLMGNIFFDRYFLKTHWIKKSAMPREQEKLSPLEILFQKYGSEYGFDWLALAAQAYQESGFDHSKTSHRGAVGVMQIMPSTAADKWVSISDIENLENNVHAGVKYLSFLRERYFNSPEIAPEDRIFFAWAAYNAGPARINQLRREAALTGLNPNKWFDNVEKIAALHIGRETVEYVANVNKYYVAFRLGYERS